MLRWLTITVLAAATTGCRERRSQTFLMTWEAAVEERDPAFPEADAVRFRYVKSPGCYEVLHQPDLVELLKSKGRDTVPVTIDVTSGILGTRSGTAWYSVAAINGTPYRYFAYTKHDHGGCQAGSKPPFDMAKD